MPTQKNPSPRSVLSGLLSAAALCFGIAGTTLADVVSYENAQIITCKDGATFTIPKGRLVVNDGRIVFVGDMSAEIPPNAKPIDCTGKVIMPGLVDTHSHVGGGIGGADGSAPIQPEVRVLDSVNSRDSGFRRVVSGGITSVNVMPGSGHLLSGQTIYLKLRAPTDPARPGPDGKPADSHAPGRFDDWFYRFEGGAPMGGMKMANGTNSIREAPFPGTRAKSAALVREQYVKAQEYAAKATKRAAAPDPDKLPPLERNLAMEGLGECLTGKRIVQHHTHRADDIMTVLRLAEEFKFRVVLHHVSEAWKVADEIAKADTGWGKKGIKGTPCSVIVVDSPGGKLEAADMTHASGGILERAGVTVAFHTDDWITDSRFFLRSAALAVRAGMTREGALKAMTINGAMMLDLESKVGTLEAGKDADFIILSGDPLSVYTHVEQTFVEGKKVFDRADSQDRLFATGGYGAGRDQSPYLCCVGGDGAFTFNGRQWGTSNGGGGADNAADAQR